MDRARAAVADLGLIAAASEHLTTEVAMLLPFEALGPFKTALKKLFSRQPWTADDDDELHRLVRPHFTEGWWEHDLGHGLTLSHGIESDRYRVVIYGEPEIGESIWDRVFSGPVLPQQTPHPRKVRFEIGGEPAPGRWHRRGEAEHDDPRVVELMTEPDISDVMVAGNFVTVGLERGSSWEDRLDDILGMVERLFWNPDAVRNDGERTRDELMSEAGGIDIGNARPEELHLLDPDRPEHRELLVTALDHNDPRARRAAIATLALSGEDEVAKASLITGFRDRARMVKRTAVDAAADRQSEEYRPMFEEALGDGDAWIRWKAVSALADLGVGPSRPTVAALADDPDFRVRFEVAAALR